jgi:hypothetical protein
MKALPFLILFLFLLSPTSHGSDCPISLKEIELCAQYEWKEGPHWGRFSTLEVKYWRIGDSEKKPQNLPEDVVVFPWMIMPRGEHGGRSPIVSILSEGHYQYERFQFGKMPGHWEVRWRKKSAGERDVPLAALRVNLPE